MSRRVVIWWVCNLAWVWAVGFLVGLWASYAARAVVAAGGGA